MVLSEAGVTLRDHTADTMYVRACVSGILTDPTAFHHTQPSADWHACKEMRHTTCSWCLCAAAARSACSRESPHHVTISASRCWPKSWSRRSSVVSCDGFDMLTNSRDLEDPPAVPGWYDQRWTDCDESAAPPLPPPHLDSLAPGDANCGSHSVFCTAGAHGPVAHGGCGGFPPPSSEEGGGSLPHLDIAAAKVEADDSSEPVLHGGGAAVLDVAPRGGKSLMGKEAKGEKKPKKAARRKHWQPGSRLSLLASPSPLGPTLPLHSPSPLSPLSPVPFLVCSPSARPVSFTHKHATRSAFPTPLLPALPSHLPFPLSLCLS